MRPVLTITFILITVGIIMIYSASAIFAEDKFGDQYYFLKRQLMWACLGIAAMTIASFIPMELLRTIAKPLLILVWALLILVFVPHIGAKVGGARRWLRFGGWGVQPSEAAKLVLIIYSAHFLSRKQRELTDFRQGLLPLVIVLGITVTMILLQPDLGTALLIGAVSFIIMFIAGARVKHLLGLVSLAAPAIVLMIFRVSYRWQRILVFLNPWKDSANTGYQITQSFIALGSGGIIGRGWGQSIQKLYYLPESYTDFIFSIIGEEIGFIGTSAILLLFVAFVCHGMKISGSAPNLFTHLVGMGITIMIGLQGIIHMGVVTGCLPTKGLPLPFVSFGGSSLLVNMIGAGLLINISRHKTAVSRQWSAGR